MVFNAEASNFGSTFFDVGYWVEIQVIHDVSRVVVHPNIWVVDLAYDFSTSFSGTSRARRAV